MNPSPKRCGPLCGCLLLLFNLLRAVTDFEFRTLRVSVANALGR